jgi:putative ABC transport system ATP-binding protein
MVILEAKDVSYVYKTKQQAVEAVKGFSQSFEQGKFYAILGRSGSGKSTILNLLGGLADPTTGEVLYQGQSLSELDKTKYRREESSFVFQNFNLFPMLTALENVVYILWLQEVEKSDAIDKAKQALASVGLEKKYYDRLPRQLSGGEQQRVAIARSLVSGANVILADEPTGNLDEKNSKVVFEILRDLSQSKDITVILATHDLAAKEVADELIEL